MIPPVPRVRRPSRRRPRGLKLFGVGDEKTGTHSLAGLFGHYRAEHEPEVPEFRALVCRYRRDELEDGELARYFAAKEERLALEVDSSFLNGEVIDVLAEEYPAARYVLTVREPRSWLDSMVNQAISFESPHWLELRALRVGPPEGHPPQEALLAEHGLATLDGYLHEWSRHIQRVIDHVPTEQLLILRTQDIDARLDDLAAFAGVPVDSLDLDRSHEFRGPVKHGVVDRLPPDHLAAKLAQHTAALAASLGLSAPAA